MPPSLEIEVWFNTADGEAIDLDSLRGHPVFVEFWSIQCAPCVATIDKIRRVHAGYSSKGLQLLTVHVDSHEPRPDALSVGRFLDENSISYPVGFDVSGAIWERFEFTHLPHGLYLDTDSRAQWSGSLFNHDVDEVLERLLGGPAPIEEPLASATGPVASASGASDCEDGACPVPVREQNT